MTNKEDNENFFESWEKVIREAFLASLEAAKEIEPNTPEWTFVWNTLHCFKSYAERKSDHKNDPQGADMKKERSE
jgi:hypothetical protein